MGSNRRDSFRCGSFHAFLRRSPRRLRQSHLSSNARHRRSRRMRTNWRCRPSLMSPKIPTASQEIRRVVQLHQDHLPKFRAIDQRRHDLAEARRHRLGKPRYRIEIHVLVRRSARVHGLVRPRCDMGQYRHAEFFRSVQHVHAAHRHGQGLWRSADQPECSAAVRDHRRVRPVDPERAAYVLDRL